MFKKYILLENEQFNDELVGKSAEELLDFKGFDDGVELSDAAEAKDVACKCIDLGAKQVFVIETDLDEFGEEQSSSVVGSYNNGEQDGIIDYEQPAVEESIIDDDDDLPKTITVTLQGDYETEQETYTFNVSREHGMVNLDNVENKLYFSGIDLDDAVNEIKLVGDQHGFTIVNVVRDYSKEAPVTEDTNYAEMEAMGLMRYLFDEIKTNSREGYNIDWLPDYEEVIDRFDAYATKAEYVSAVKRLTNALEDVEFYIDSEGSGLYLQLSDNHTMWEINSNISPEHYTALVNNAVEDFKIETGVDLYLIGRSGRHACVEYTLENVLNYDGLKAYQNDLEKKVIADANGVEGEDE